MPEPGNSSSDDIIRLSLTCDLTAVPAAAQAVCSFLAQHGCSEPLIMSCELALVEACNNAIIYSRANDQPVQIEARCLCEQIEMRVTDHTEGFVWPDHIRLPPPENECGR